MWCWECLYAEVMFEKYEVVMLLEIVVIIMVRPNISITNSSGDYRDKNDCNNVCCGDGIVP